MFNPLPAILIGGPPHAGKSVLTYSLTQALRKRNIDHYVIRACPDGEGDWSQEIDQEAVRVIRVKGTWTPNFVERICRDLDRRHFPVLVDMGGRPEVWQSCILSHCTHSLLLLHPHDEHTIEFWRQLAEENGLLPLAQLYSALDTTSTITSKAPVLEGTLTGLNRGALAQGPLFDLLVERVGSLFASYSQEELRKSHLNSAPVEAVDLDTFLQAWAPASKRWEPEMIVRLLAELPSQTPLAIYGRGTNWLYGALVAYAGTQLFYQFDPRLGWVTPPPLQVGAPTISSVQVDLREHIDANLLTVRLVHHYLDYTEAEQLVFPPIPPERGLILSGKLPHWLVTALVRLYNAMGAPWIACYYPQRTGAIVVAAHTSAYSLGELIPLPFLRVE